MLDVTDGEGIPPTPSSTRKAHPTALKAIVAAGGMLLFAAAAVSLNNACDVAPS